MKKKKNGYWKLGSKKIYFVNFMHEDLNDSYDPKQKTSVQWKKKTSTIFAIFKN